MIRSRRRIRPTKEGWVFLGSGLAVALAALNTGNNLLYLVFATMLSMVALSGVLSELSVQRVQLTRRLSSRAFVGEPVRGSWAVSNQRAFLSHLVLQVEESPGREAWLTDRGRAAFPIVAAGETERADGLWRFDHRGIHRLSGARVATTWPFGIFLKWYDIAAPMDVLVHPRPLSGARGEAEPLAGEGMSSPTARRGGGEFLGLRDHRAGEDPRRIHWRSTARLGRRVAIDAAAEQGARVQIRVPAPSGATHQARGESFERSLSVATGAALAAFSAGRGVRLDFPDGASILAEPSEPEPVLRALALAELPAGAS